MSNLQYNLNPEVAVSSSNSGNDNNSGITITVNVILNNVCPNKKIALLVLLTKTDSSGNPTTTKEVGRQFCQVTSDQLTSCGQLSVPFKFSDECNKNKEYVYNAEVIANYVG